MSMTTTTLTAQGQIIIPKEIRERRGWSAGIALELVEQGDSVLVRPAHSRTTVDQLLGCLPHRGQPKTLEDMEAAIAKGSPQATVSR